MVDEGRAYLWIVNWEKHQDALRKRGKPWSPPWVKLEPSLLDHDDFNALPAGTQLVFLKLLMLFARARLVLASDPRRLSRQLGVRVTSQQLESLNHAGFIEFCSRTVLEHRRAMFWNRSNLEKRREEQTEGVDVGPNGARARDPDEHHQANILDRVTRSLRNAS